jgi:hypothetical protein
LPAAPSRNQRRPAPPSKTPSWSSQDTELTFDDMPSQFFTLRAELTYRHAGVPYVSGPAESRRRRQPRRARLADHRRGRQCHLAPRRLRDEPRLTLARMVEL